MEVLELKRNENLYKEDFVELTWSLESILQEIKKINGILNVNELTKKILDAGLRISDSQRATILLLTDDLKVTDQISVDRKGNQLLNNEFLESRRIIDQTISTGETFSKEFKSNKKDWIFKNIIDLNIRKTICLPLEVEKKRIAVIYFDSSISSRNNFVEIEKAIKIFIEQISVSLNNALKYEAESNLRKEIEKEKKQLESEHFESENAEKIKYEFLAQMSHEIRTPINKIISFTSILKDHFQKSFDAELINNCKIIDNGGKRLVRTIDLMLDMSQIKSGTFTIEKEKVALVSEILQPIEKEYMQLARAKGLNFELIDNSSHSQIFADSTTVKQIITEIVDNAVKYTITGSVEIIVYNDENENVCVEVRDTGIGISEEYLKKIFKPFTQEHTGYSRPYEGNGLALSLVKEYADLNDIKIEIESIKNVGSNFKLIF